MLCGRSITVLPCTCLVPGSPVLLQVLTYIGSCFPISTSKCLWNRIFAFSFVKVSAALSFVLTQRKFKRSPFTKSKIANCRTSICFVLLVGWFAFTNCKQA